jgi:hypothetical protein
VYEKRKHIIITLTKKRIVMARKAKKKNVSTKNSWWITPNESLLDYVIRICKSIKIVIILAIPGAIYGSIQLWEWYKDYKNRPQRELRIKIDELHTDIDNDIKKIRELFKPEDIREEEDSTGELALIKDYEQEALDFCRLYESVHSTPYSEISTKDDSWVSDTQNHLDRLIRLNKMEMSLNIKFIKLIENAQNNHIVEYVNIDALKYKVITSSLENKNIYFAKASEKTTEAVEKMDVDGLSVIINSLTNDTTTLKADKRLFSSIIEIDNVLSKRIRILQQNSKSH